MSGRWIVPRNMANGPFVVMNADGSVGVDASLVRGVRLSNVVAVLWGVFALGVISPVGGQLLVLRGIGKPKTEPSDVARDVHFGETRLNVCDE